MSVFTDEDIKRVVSRLENEKYMRENFNDVMLNCDLELVKKVLESCGMYSEKKYIIILPDLHQFKGVQAYSEYVYVTPYGELAKTKSYDHIERISETQLEALPSWLSQFAKEVK